MLRLYLDEDMMSLALTEGLRSSGIDVSTVADERMRGHDDAAQLAFAATQGRTIVSFNVGDFMRLHSQYMRSSLHHGGTILAPQQRFGVGELLRRLRRVAVSRQPHEMTDRVEFLNDWG